MPDVGMVLPRIGCPFSFKKDAGRFMEDLMRERDESSEFEFQEDEQELPRLVSSLVLNIDFTSMNLSL